MTESEIRERVLQHNRGIYYFIACNPKEQFTDDSYIFTVSFRKLKPNKPLPKVFPKRYRLAKYKDLIPKGIPEEIAKELEPGIWRDPLVDYTDWDRIKPWAILPPYEKPPKGMVLPMFKNQVLDESINKYNGFLILRRPSFSLKSLVGEKGKKYRRRYQWNALHKMEKSQTIKDETI